MNGTLNALRRWNTAPIWVLTFFVVASILTPTSLWVRSSVFDVHSAVVGFPVVITYDGETVRNFKGEYSVILRDVESQEIVCEARGGPIPYLTTSKRPDPLTLDWWAPSDPRCHSLNLGVGTYHLTTCWNIYPYVGSIPSPIPKVRCVETEKPFSVLPRG